MKISSGTRSVNMGIGPAIGGAKDQLVVGENLQRVGEPVKSDSVRPNAQAGRTRKQAFDGDLKNSIEYSVRYFSLVRATKAAIAAGWSINSASPSITTGS